MATTELNILQPSPPVSRREQWLEERRGYIGGSDSAAMFSEGYGCLRRLVYDKRGTKPDWPRTREEEQTLRRGTELEEMVVWKFQQETDLRVRTSRTAISKDHAHAGVNVDRIILTPTLDDLTRLGLNPETFVGPGVLECKTANENVYKDFVKNGVNHQYVFQMQHSLGVKGYQWGAFAVLGYGPRLWELHWFPMLRDEALIDAILARTDEVWHFIEDGPLPDALRQPDKRCRNCQFRKTCLGTAYTEPPKEAGDYIDDYDAELGELVQGIVNAKGEAAEIEADVKKMQDQLKQILGDRERVGVPALGLRIRYATVLKNIVDSQALKAKYPEIAKECTKPSNSRPLYIE